MRGRHVYFLALGFANSDRQWIVTAYALTIGSLCIGAVLLAAFALIEQRVAAPLRPRIGPRPLIGLGMLIAAGGTFYLAAPSRRSPRSTATTVAFSVAGCILVAGGVLVLILIQGRAAARPAPEEPADAGAAKSAASWATHLPRPSPHQIFTLIPRSLHERPV